ncbi:hypothetical protein KBI23_01920 [bacterium]|nr:hypothetical protein [bacterium]MBP9808788.1 hypothetical protein [bacterium]
MTSGISFLKDLDLRTLYITAAATVAVLCAPCAHSGDGSFCHDLPARQSVLDEGKEYLDQHGSISKRAHGRGFADFGLLRYSSNQKKNLEFQNISSFEIDHLPLETPQQLIEAETLAGKLECAQHFKSAHRLYLRVLEQREKEGGANILLVQALESTARAEILAMANLPMAVSQDTNDWDSGPQYDNYALDTRFFGSAVVRRAIKTAPDITAIQNAEPLYARARALREKLQARDGKLVSDLLILASIKDRLNKTNEANSLYVEASQLDKDAIKNLAAFAFAHRDFNLTNENESAFLSQAATKRDSASTSVLLAYYLAEKRSNDTLQLFRQTMSNSVFVPADVLISMFDIISANDVEQLTEYVAKVWLTKSDLNHDLVKLIRAMKEHGWGKSTDTLCQLGAYRFPIFNQTLLVIAECYRQSDNPTGALSVYRTILKSILANREPNLGAIKELSEILTALNSKDMKQAPECQDVLLSISKEIEFQKSGIRHRQCLDMAAQLNKTAYDLERGGHNEMAQKLYQEALEIKQLNLAKDDPETASQMLDVARTSAAQKNYALAQSLYENALAGLRKSPPASGGILKQALEGYGQLLNQMNQQEKANKIYDEARELARRR